MSPAMVAVERPSAWSRCTAWSGTISARTSLISSPSVTVGGAGGVRRRRRRRRSDRPGPRAARPGRGRARSTPAKSPTWSTVEILSRTRLSPRAVATMPCASSPLASGWSSGASAATAIGRPPAAIASSAGCRTGSGRPTSSGRRARRAPGRWSTRRPAPTDPAPRPVRRRRAGGGSRPERWRPGWPARPSSASAPRCPTWPTYRPSTAPRSGTGRSARRARRRSAAPSRCPMAACTWSGCDC